MDPAPDHRRLGLWPEAIRAQGTGKLWQRNDPVRVLYRHIAQHPDRKAGRSRHLCRAGRHPRHSRLYRTESAGILYDPQSRQQLAPGPDAERLCLQWPAPETIRHPESRNSPFYICRRSRGPVHRQCARQCRNVLRQSVCAGIEQLQRAGNGPVLPDPAPDRRQCSIARRVCRITDPAAGYRAGKRMEMGTA